MPESEYQEYAHVQRRLLKQVMKGWNQETRNERRAQRAFDDGIFQARLTEMAANHNAEMAEMAANYQALMQELAENHEASMQELDAEYQRGIDSMEAWPKFIDNCLLWAAVLVVLAGIALVLPLKSSPALQYHKKAKEMGLKSSRT